MCKNDIIILTTSLSHPYAKMDHRQLNRQLNDSIETAFLNFDPHALAISRDPLQWSIDDVVKFLNFLKLNVACYVNCIDFAQIDISVLSMYNGKQLAHMGLDQMCNNSMHQPLFGHSFGDVLWHSMKCLMLKDARTRRILQTMNNSYVVERPSEKITQNHKIRRIDPSKPYMWQFILDLLFDVGANDVISWTQKKIWQFEIKDTRRFAEMWGESRGRQNVKYTDVCSVICSYYYKKQNPILFKPFPRKFSFKRQIYQFNRNTIFDAIRKRASEEWRRRFSEKSGVAC